MSGSDEHHDFQWHDDTIYALHLDAPDPDRNVWRSDLVLDIDHIVEWVCGADGGVKFRVAPATSIFHDVTDLRIAIDFGKGALRGALNELSIDSVVRAPAAALGAAAVLSLAHRLKSAAGRRDRFRRKRFHAHTARRARAARWTTAYREYLAASDSSARIAQPGGCTRTQGKGRRAIAEPSELYRSAAPGLARDYDPDACAATWSKNPVTAAMRAPFSASTPKSVPATTGGPLAGANSQRNRTRSL